MAATVVTVRKRRSAARAHALLATAAIVWLFPILYALYTSLRRYEVTADLGYASFGGALSFHNYREAWAGAELSRYYVNSLIVTLPSVVLALALASLIAFGASRFSWKFNVPLLMLFTAGNLLPPQVIVTPLYRLFLEIPLPAFMSDSEVLYDSYWGLIAINVAFQSGFCVFVLSNYMRTIPVELTEAATIDGASVWRQYRQIILPLCRPPLAGLAALLFAWVYNDFFWAQVLMPSGDKRPITSAIVGLQGQFFSDNNLVAAAALLAALPPLIVYLALQRHLVGGLALGGSKH